MSLLLFAALSAPVVYAKDTPKEGPTEFQKNAAKFLVKCGKCHTIGRGDRVGPDLKGVTQRRDRKWLVGFIMNPGEFLENDPEAIELLKKFNGVKMENLRLPQNEVEGFLEFIEAASKGPAGPVEPVPLEPEDPYGKLTMPDEGLSSSPFGVVFLVLSLIVAGVFWQFGIPLVSVLLLLISATAAYWSFGGRHHHRLLGNQQSYSPEQPIYFSHKKHAGDMRIACLYCHHGAEKSPVAGVPSVNICMNCHSAVKTTGTPPQPSVELTKLASFWDSRLTDAPESIEWVRVHKLPDYVRFSHQVHVGNNIQCQECHGPVQEMERMRQAASLAMGWCVNCHRQGSGKAPTHWKRSKATLDCAACHW